VDGFYYFCNIDDSKMNRTLFYPFPQANHYGKIDSVFVIDQQNTSKKVDFKMHEKGLSFKILIEPDASAIYRIGYRQKLKNYKAEYILTTTQLWGIPFEQVNYTLEFPKEYLLDSISYMPDSLREESDKYIFYWHKENFMPEKNFEITYKEKENF